MATSPRMTTKEKYSIFCDIFGDEYRDREFTDKEKKQISKRKQIIAEKQKIQSLHYGKHNTNFFDYGSALEDYIIRRSFKENLVLFFITYNFMRTHKRPPSIATLIKQMERHYVRILSRLFGRRRFYYEKHKHFYPTVILFPEWHKGGIVGFDTPHFHGILMIHESLAEFFRNPLKRHYMNQDFQELEDGLGLQFNVRTISHEAGYVFDYAKKSNPFLPIDTRLAADDVLWLPKSTSETAK